MTVVVTGGCGFLGGALVSRLAKSGEEIIVLDDLSSGSTGNLPSHVKFVRGCATDRNAIRAAVSDAEIIYHLASVVGQIRVHRDPAWALRVSEVSTRLLLEEAPGIPLVLFSSSSVYGLYTTDLCSEESSLPEARALAYDGEIPGYAVGKLRAERIALSQRRRSPILIVRPFNAVGPGQLGSYGMVMPRFVEAALSGSAIQIYGDGQQSRCFSASWVLIESLLALVALWRAGRVEHSIYNLASNVETTINELADAVERHSRQPLLRQFVPYEEIYPGKLDVQRRFPSTERLQDALGSIIWPSIDEIVLRIMARHQRSHDAAATVPFVSRSSA